VVQADGNCTMALADIPVTQSLKEYSLPDLTLTSFGISKEGGCCW
jgi:hypothetical protein